MSSPNITSTGNGVLVDVDPTAQYKGSPCTRITLMNSGGNTEYWHMKKSTFDVNGTITDTAINLKGKHVQLHTYDAARWLADKYFCYIVQK